MIRIAFSAITVLALAATIADVVPSCGGCGSNRRPPPPACGKERRCSDDALPFGKIAKTLQEMKLDRPAEQDAMVQIASGLETHYLEAKRHCDEANRCVITEDAYAKLNAKNHAQVVEWQGFADTATHPPNETARRTALALLYARIVPPDRSVAFAIDVRRTQPACPEKTGTFERVEITATIPVHFYVVEHEGDRYFPAYPTETERLAASGAGKKQITFDDHRTACAAGGKAHRAALFLAASRHVLSDIDHAIPSVERSREEGARLFASPVRGVVLPKGSGDAAANDDEIVLLSEAGDDAIAMPVP